MPLENVSSISWETTCADDAAIVAVSFFNIDELVQHVSLTNCTSACVKEQKGVLMYKPYQG